MVNMWQSLATGPETSEIRRRKKYDRNNCSIFWWPSAS